MGGVEIEPSTQTHQTTKVVHMYTTDKPEEALFKYQNLGGYKDKYDSKKVSQLHQVPIAINNDGPFQLLLEQITRPLHRQNSQVEQGQMLVMHTLQLVQLS